MFCVLCRALCDSLYTCVHTERHTAIQSPLNNPIIIPSSSRNKPTWQFFLESCSSFKSDQLASQSQTIASVTVSHYHAEFRLHLDVIQLSRMTHLAKLQQGHSIIIYGLIEIISVIVVFYQSSSYFQHN